MTNTQKKALEIMRERNAGAINDGFGWTWPEDIRNSEEAAWRVLVLFERKAAAA